MTIGVSPDAAFYFVLCSHGSARDCLGRFLEAETNIVERHAETCICIEAVVGMYQLCEKCDPSKVNAAVTWKAQLNAMSVLAQSTQPAGKK